MIRFVLESITIITLLFVGESYGRSHGSYEHELREMLLSKYDKVVRPQDPKGKESPTKVQFGLKLNRLVKVDNKEQTVVVDTWIIMKWNNTFFSWDKTKYGGTDRIRFESTEIWFPDISLHNNADSSIARAGGPNFFISNVVVTSNGLNIWSGPATFTASCTMKLNAWPFDDQSCDLKFGSITYGSHLLQLMEFKTKKPKGENFKESGNWELNSDLQIQIGKADFGNCCPYSFDEISFKVKMMRRYRYHLFYLVAPCIALSFLTIIGFYIPSDSGERIGFTTTLMLGMMVFLLVVPDSLPESSEALPILGVLMMSTMVMVGIALLATIFVLRCHHSTGTPPKYLRCLSKRPSRKKTIPKPDSAGNEIEITVVRPKDEAIEKTCTIPDDNEFEFTWQSVASTLDRIFFWVFLIISVVLYGVCLTFRF